MHLLKTINVNYKSFGIYLFSFFGLLSTPVFAVQILIHNPCSETPWLDAQTAFASEISLGKITIDTLNHHKIPFVGNEVGINSINDTVIGEKAMEIISDHEFRAYGWCFHLNDFEPALTADQVKITADNEKVTWFFAYARYLNGAWTDMCVPTHISKPAFICQ